MFEISERDLFWLAGYLEGEGCFSVRKVPAGTEVRQRGGGYNALKRARFCFSIIAATTDKDVAEHVARIFRATVVQERRDKRGRRKPCYIVQLGRRQEVRELLTLLLPLMGERRSAKIREMLREEAEYPEYNRPERVAHMRSFLPKRLLPKKRTPPQPETIN